MPSVRLDKPRQTLQVVEGGKAGVGNAVLSKSKRQRSTVSSLFTLLNDFFILFTQPTTKMPGEPGQSKVLHLELKIIADVGLVGFPNVSHGESKLCSRNNHPHLLSSGRQVVSGARVVKCHAQSGFLSVHDAAPVHRGRRVQRHGPHHHRRHSRWALRRKFCFV